ncbi:MAG TPA: hypothetical protein V6C76_03640 [Drouetiella sp.]
MQLSRKGATNSIPIWLLALTVGLIIFRVALLSGHSSQVPVKFVDWHAFTDLQTVAKEQSKPILLYYVGDNSSKTQAMNDSVFSNRIVAAAVLNNFYPVIVPGTAELDGDEKKFVRRLYKKYMVVQVPSLVITTPAGSEVSHMNGFKPAAPTYQFLKTVAESDKLKATEESDHAPKSSSSKSHKLESDDDSHGEPSASDVMHSLPSRSILRF